MNRRNWIKTVGLAGGSLAGASPFTIFKSDEKNIDARRSLRIAHITDTHLEEESSEKWMRTCLDHIHNQEDRPDIIIGGGDIINDALGRGRDSIDQQWKIWDRVSKQIELPIYYCIGNHDVWGDEAWADAPLHGKKRAMKEFGLKNRYYDFERAGWHFIVLDSTHKKADGSWYTAKLDDEQFVWLEQTLNSIDDNKPVFIVSHIPIMCAAAFFDGDNEKSGNWQIPGAWVHIDARKIVELFYKHPNVQAAISGHIHLLDTVVYNDVSYYCNGAVCGRWWGGNYHQTHPGYALINLYEDGQFDREYVAYGW